MTHRSPYVFLSLPHRCLEILAARINREHPQALADRTILRGGRPALRLDSLAVEVDRSRLRAAGANWRAALEAIEAARAALEAFDCSNNPIRWRQSRMVPALDKIREFRRAVGLE